MDRATSRCLQEEHWSRATDGERGSALAEVVEQLGGDWRALAVEDGPRGPIGRVLHTALGLAFCLVPGGTFELGLTTLDLKTCRKLAANADERALLKRQRAPKPRKVALPPFFLAETVVPPETLALLDGGCVPEAFGVAAARIPSVVSGLGARGLRLPTADEWEAAARGGTDALFPSGLDELPDPSDTTPSGFGHRRLGALAECCVEGMVRGGALLSWPWQGTGEWLLMRCAAPAEPTGTWTAFRPVVDIAGTTANKSAPLVRRSRSAPEVKGPPAGSLEGLDAIAWKSMKVARGKASAIPEALTYLADPEETHANREIAIRRLNDATNHTGPVLTGAVAMAPFAVRLLPGLSARHRASLAAVLARAVGAGDPEAECLGIPSAPHHEKRYWAGAGKRLLEALSLASETALEMTEGETIDERVSGIFLLTYVPGASARRDARFAELAKKDGDRYVRAIAAYGLAMGARRGGAGVIDAVIDDVAKALGEGGRSLAAIMKVLRDGEAANDGEIVACGVEPAEYAALSAFRDLFPWGGVGGLHRVVTTVLCSAGPRGVRRVEELMQAQREAYLRMMGR